MLFAFRLLYSSTFIFNIRNLYRSGIFIALLPGSCIAFISPDIVTLLIGPVSTLLAVFGFAYISRSVFCGALVPVKGLTKYVQGRLRANINICLVLLQVTNIGTKC